MQHVNPVLEKWNSGGSKYAVRCNNPDRGDDCDLNGTQINVNYIVIKLNKRKEPFPGRESVHGTL